MFDGKSDTVTAPGFGYRGRQDVGRGFERCDPADADAGISQYSRPVSRFTCEASGHFARTKQLRRAFAFFLTILLFQFLSLCVEDQP